MVQLTLEKQPDGDLDLDSGSCLLFSGSSPVIREAEEEEPPQPSLSSLPNTPHPPPPPAPFSLFLQPPSLSAGISGR